jgi:hypothetical protein
LDLEFIFHVKTFSVFETFQEAFADAIKQSLLRFDFADVGDAKLVPLACLRVVGLEIGVCGQTELGYEVCHLGELEVRKSRDRLANSDRRRICLAQDHQ